MGDAFAGAMERTLRGNDGIAARYFTKLAFCGSETKSTRDLNEMTAVLTRCKVPFESLSGSAIAQRYPQFRFARPGRRNS